MSQATISTPDGVRVSFWFNYEQRRGEWVVGACIDMFNATVVISDDEMTLVLEQLREAMPTDRLRFGLGAASISMPIVRGDIPQVVRAIEYARSNPIDAGWGN